MRTSAAPLISIDSISKRYGSETVVDKLSFGVEAGTITGFLGPNGAGKTTTIRILLGLASASGGSATISGRRYEQLTAPAESVGAMLDGAGFHPGRSGRNHLRYLAATAGIPASRVEEVLEMVEMKPAANKRVKGYSTGMRQRLGLAVALLGDPEVMILDEPANGLDPGGVRWLRDLLRDRAAQGATVLVSSHVLAEVAQTVDDVVVISKGRLIAQGPVEELVASSEGAVVPVELACADQATMAEALRAAEAEVTTTDDGGLLVVGMGAPEIGELALKQGIALHRLAERRRSLEDAFLALTDGEGEL